MLLAVDIGNTNITLGLFEGPLLQATWRLATDVERTPDEYGVMLLSMLHQAGVDTSAVEAAVMCSSVPPLVAAVQELSERYFGVKPLVVDVGVRTGIRILYENPREVGPDRVVDAVAAYRLYGGPVIVVDFGTATVFDAVSAEGDYLGGAIAPGVGIAAEALFQRAARLPRIELVPPPRAIGRTTVQSMQSGIIFGYVGLIEGIVARFRSELGQSARVIATGGLAPIVAPHSPCVDRVDLDLTLHGLRMIYDANTPGSGFRVPGSEPSPPARSPEPRTQKAEPETRNPEP